MRRVAAALIVCMASSAAAESPVDAVLRALGAADAARAALAAEQSEAALDVQRQAALVATLRAEARRYVALAERDEARAAAITTEDEAAAASAELAALERAAGEAATQIEARLAALDPRGDGADAMPDATDATDAMPDAIQGAMPDAMSASERLRRALARLRAAEQSAGRVDVSIATGRLGAETIAAQVVWVGWAAGWWRALDGSAAGVIERGVFRPLDAAGAAAVADAIAVVSRQRPPALVSLPVGGEP